MCKCFVTHSAHKLAFACVGQEMSVEITFAYESCAAMVTFVSSIVGVSANVNAKLMFVCKSFLTHLTLMRFLARVQQHVIVQMVFATKPLSAIWTHKLAISTVDNLM